MSSSLAVDRVDNATRAPQHHKHERPKDVRELIIGANALLEDKVDIGMDKIYKSLTVLADKVVAKLNELLKDEVPQGVASLKAENHTAQATAERIFQGVASLFSAFERQNPKLKGEELMKKFMEIAKSGIKEGYEDAMKILKGIGAFEFEGVEDGIQETMKLLDEKLSKFADDYKAGLKKDVSAESAEPAKAS